MRGRRHEDDPRNVRSSPSADEQAVHAAEAIVGRAWVEQLLRYHDRMRIALDAAGETCQAAVDRLCAEQRGGDPGRISTAHAVLEHAIAAHHAIEAASRQAHEALQAALDALAASTADHPDPATTGRPRRPVQSSGRAVAIASEPARRPMPPQAAMIQGVRRARQRIERLLARRVRGPERSS